MSHSNKNLNKFEGLTNLKSYFFIICIKRHDCFILICTWTSRRVSCFVFGYSVAVSTMTVAVSTLNKSRYNYSLLMYLSLLRNQFTTSIEISKNEFEKHFYFDY